tara:strand:+ start:2253 stop:2945 length:693 start_codon:yes stop_codon:yes gene_type:complete
MLISNSNNFVFIRVEKTASTSGLFYFLNSNLYNPEKDLVELDGVFNSWEHMEKHFYDYPVNYLEQAALMPMPNYFIPRNVHYSFRDLVSQKKINQDMPCFATIRNPIDRLCSSYFYERKKLNESVLNLDINEFCYRACLKDQKEIPKYAGKLQSSYYPEHTKLWNTENLHDHAVNDIKLLGGKVDKNIHVRSTGAEINYQESLSNDVIDTIMIKYAKDFDLWEKAYAVYN